MNWIVTLYVAVLFFVLTPSILVSLPPKGSKFVVAGFHTLVFALVFHFTHRMVMEVEGFVEGVQLAKGEKCVVTDTSDRKCTELNVKCGIFNKKYDSKGKLLGDCSPEQKVGVCQEAGYGTNKYKQCAPKPVPKGR